MMNRCFLQHFVICLAFVAMAFFAVNYGIIQEIYKSDLTHMTSVIAAVFVVAVLYLGRACWHWDNNSWQVQSRNNKIINKAIADTSLIDTAAYLVTLLGLLGTAVGLMVQVRALGALDVSNPQNVITFISTIAQGLGSALWSTATGITAAIGLTVLNSNLKYFLDRDAPQ